MSERYPIYQLDSSWSSKLPPADGVLKKDWYQHPNLGKCLFKEAWSKPLRANADWTEKVVYEFAKLLNLPVARYELATGYVRDSSELINGVISLNCLPENIDREIPGRQFLIERDSSGDNTYKAYTIERVLNALDAANVLPPSNWKRIDGIDTGAKLYLGYMLLDTIVANTDRHDRNWGVVTIEDRLELIPTYDHGYSLGVHLDDAKKSNHSISRFLIETSSDFRDSDDGTLLLESDRILCSDVFEQAAKLCPEAAAIWQQQLAKITPQQIQDIIDRVPSDRITPTSAKFARMLIWHNQERILSLDVGLSQQLPTITEISQLDPIQVLDPSPAAISPVTPTVPATTPAKSGQSPTQVTLADLNDWEDDNPQIEQHPETGSLADINSSQSDDNQIEERPTNGILADLNSSDESDVEKSEEEEDGLGDSNQASL
jgi:hypothetical protein